MRKKSYAIDFCIGGYGVSDREMVYYIHVNFY